MAARAFPFDSRELLGERTLPGHVGQNNQSHRIHGKTFQLSRHRSFHGLGRWLRHPKKSDALFSSLLAQLVISPIERPSIGMVAPANITADLAGSELNRVGSGRPIQGSRDFRAVRPHLHGGPSLIYVLAWNDLENLDVPGCHDTIENRALRLKPKAGQRILRYVGEPSDRCCSRVSPHSLPRACQIAV
jgi:hypothetical protein